MKTPTILLIAAALLIGGIFVIGNKEEAAPVTSTVIQGEMTPLAQTIDIKAKGGYSTQLISAQANIPTTLKVTTSGTFDCSASLTIPSIGYRTNLPSTGVTEIEVPPQAAGTTLEGICQMGMYSFAVRFN